MNIDKTSKDQENNKGNVGSSTDESEEEDVPANPRMFGFTLKPEPKRKTSGPKKARTTRASHQPAKSTSASLSWPSPVDPSDTGGVANNADGQEEAASDGEIEVGIPTAKASEELALAEVEMEAQEIIQAAERAEQESQPQPVAPSRPAFPARVLSIGVIGYEKAPMKGRGSFCYFCEGFIPKGSWRFEYRFSASGKIPRWIHPSCTLQIPLNGRGNSTQFLEGLLASHGGDGQGLDKTLLHHIRESLGILRAMG